MIRFKQFLLEQNVYTGGLNQPATADEPEDYSSPAYFDNLDNTFSRIKAGERVDLSPMDMMSMQFGKDKVKERDEYIKKLRDYHAQNPKLETYVDIPDLSDEYLKQKIPFAIYKPSEKENPDFKMSSTTVAQHRPEVGFMASRRGNNIADTKDFQEFIKTIGQPENINTTSYVLINPDAIKDYDDDELKNVLSHELWHRLTYKNQLKSADTEEKYGIPLTTPSDIAKKYKISPSFLSTTTEMNKRFTEREMQLDRERDELMNRHSLALSQINRDMDKDESDALRKKARDDWKAGYDAYSLKRNNLWNYKNRITGMEIKDEFTNLNSKLNKNYNPGSYFWNRGEVPAYMHQLKLDLMKAKKEPYRTADQSDESIESDANFLMNKNLDIDDKDTSYPAKIKALELLKTPEGKAIWRGVEKTKPQTFNNGTRMA